MHSDTEQSYSMIDSTEFWGPAFTHSPACFLKLRRIIQHVLKSLTEALPVLTNISNVMNSCFKVCDEYVQVPLL